MNSIDQYFFNEFKTSIIEASKKSQFINFDNIIIETLNRNNLKQEDISNIESVKAWFNKVYHQDYINDLLEMYEANEFIIHSPSDVQVEGQETIKLKVEFLNQQDYELSLNFLTRKLNIDWNFAHPFASFKDTRKTTKGEIDLRLSLSHPSLTPSKSAKLFIRVHKKENFTLADFTLTKEVRIAIDGLIANYKNIVIAGSTASGKTSFLRVCKSLCDEKEHHIIIEDVSEIDGDISNTTHLLAHDSPGKSLNDYCSYALRMSPKRILLGEIRSQEIIPFILAMNTGHKGMMTTIHANNAKDTLLRLTTLFSIFSNSKNGIDFSQILKLICQSVDNVIFLEDKKVKEIIEVHGSENDTPIFSVIYENQIADHQRGLSTHSSLVG